MLYGTLLAVAVVLIAWVHSGRLRALEREAAERLGSVTGTLAAQVDGGRVAHLLEAYDSRGMLVKNTQDAWYYVLHESLRKSAEAAALEQPLRILAYDRRKAELQVVVTSAERPELRAPYGASSAKAIAEQLMRADATPRRGVFGDRVAAFDGVRDVRGALVGVLIAEEPLEGPLATARARLWRDIGIAALAFLAVGLFLFRSVGRMVRREEDARTRWQRRHEGVTDSIAYAGKIQGALIPPPERFREQFDDFFLLSRPKEVVSGDFHWYHRISDHECFVATADCTGHGLPGAMMAAIGCSILNELVTQHPHQDPAELLTLLNERMVQALHQTDRRKGAGDGMDVALCRIDRRAHEILFAGAFRPLYWIHDGQLTVINGDRKPIGGSQHDPHRRFTVHRIAYHPGDRIYLFSDGYVDQFGGPDRRKFMPRRFNELLLAHQHMPMAMQADVLERAFMEWKGSNEQVDDVCVLGIAV